MTATPSTTTSDVTPNDVKPAAYLCYVHGLLVPIVSATVSYGVGMIPEATITFFPSKHLHRFGAEDRVEVVLFYLDTAGEKNEYCLLFEGEIVRWNYTTTATNQSISVLALADIAILDKIVYGLMNTVGTVNAKLLGTDAAEIRGAGVYMQAGLMRDGLLINATAPTKVESLKPTISRPYDILQNVLMGLAGSKNQYGTEIKRDPWRGLAAVNFFSRWARKRNFINRFVACPDFDDDNYDIHKRDTATPTESTGVFPLTRAFQNAAILNVIQTQIGTWFNSSSTIREVIDNIFKLMFYELQMLPTARCVIADLKTGMIEGSLAGPRAEGNVNKKPIRLTNYYAKPRMYFSDTPKFNVVFPSMMTSFSYTEDYATQPTRVYVNEEMEQQLLNTENGDLVDQLSQAILAVAYPPEAQEHLNYSIRQKINLADPVTDSSNGVPYGTAKNMLIYPEEFYRGPAVVRGKAPSVFNMYARDIAKDQNFQPDKALRQELQNYAEYEYYTQRYNKRGGQVSMVFNPYVVPGYPTTIINRPGGISVLGYVVAVSHSLSATSMSTSMTYTGGRTVLEALKLLKEDRENLNLPLTTAPRDPIAEVMQVTQLNATDHYAKLFYDSGKNPPETSPEGRAVITIRPFDPQNYTWGLDQFLLTVNNDGKLSNTEFKVTVDNDTKIENPPARKAQEKDSVQSSATYALNDVNIADVVGMELKPEFDSQRDGTNAAMEYVRRPVCTLNQYVAFRNGLVIGEGNTVDTAVAAWFATTSSTFRRNPSNKTENPGGTNTADKRQRYSSAPYYDRIAWFDITPVPDRVKNEIAQYYREGNVDNSTQPRIKAAKQIQTLPGDAYHSYKDWDTILQAYRKEIWDDQPNEP